MSLCHITVTLSLIKKLIGSAPSWVLRVVIPNGGCSNWIIRRAFQVYQGMCSICDGGGAGGHVLRYFRPDLSGPSGSNGRCKPRPMAQLPPEKQAAQVQADTNSLKEQRATCRQEVNAVRAACQRQIWAGKARKESGATAINRFRQRLFLQLSARGMRCANRTARRSAFRLCASLSSVPEPNDISGGTTQRGWPPRSSWSPDLDADAVSTLDNAISAGKPRRNRYSR